MPAKKLMVQEEADELKSLMSQLGALHHAHDLEIKKRNKTIEGNLARLRQRLEKGETTGDRIRDYVLLHYGINVEREEWYRKAEARLKGYDGQLVLVCSTRLVHIGPLIRYAHQTDGEEIETSRIMAPPRGKRILKKDYQLAVLNGEELNLEEFLPWLPTGPHVIWSVEDRSSDTPVLNDGFEKKDLLLPLSPPKGSQHVYYSPLVHTELEEEDVHMGQELFIGDDEVGEVFKQNKWRSLYFDCMKRLGRHDLVPEVSSIEMG